MLSDFLTLEVYFGSHNAAMFFEDLVKRYGRQRAKHALKSGDLECRTLQFGPDEGKPLIWLTSQGRQKAALLKTEGTF